MDNTLMIIIFGACVILMLAIIFFGMSASKKKGSQFMNEHPDYAKLFLLPADKSTTGSAMKAGLGVGVTIKILAVDGKSTAQNVSTISDVKNAIPLVMDPAGGQFIPCPPGTHTLSLSANHTRPGLMYKSVETNYGPIDISVTLAPAGSYTITFDRDNVQFGIEQR